MTTIQVPMHLFGAKFVLRSTIDMDTISDLKISTEISTEVVEDCSVKGIDRATSEIIKKAFHVNTR